MKMFSSIYRTFSLSNTETFAFLLIKKKKLNEM